MTVVEQVRIESFKQMIQRAFLTRRLLSGRLVDSCRQVQQLPSEWKMVHSAISEPKNAMNNVV